MSQFNIKFYTDSDG